jgi:hypothetical protein
MFFSNGLFETPKDEIMRYIFSNVLFNSEAEM